MPTITGQSVVANAAAQIGQAAAGGLNAQNRELFHEAHKWRVRIAGQLRPENAYTPLSVDRSVGMKRADQAVVAVELATSDNPFSEGSQIKRVEIGDTLEIFDASAGRTVFWGIVEDNEVHFGQTADERKLIASIQPHHFGDPIATCQFLALEDNPQFTRGAAVQGGVVAVHEPIVFNGWPDPRKHMAAPSNQFAMSGNRTSSARFAPLGPDGKPVAMKSFLFVPLDAVQTSAGRTRYAGDYTAFSPTAAFWTLRDAVRYLCAVGNTRGLIQNPTDKDLDVLSPVVLYRTELPVGLMLTEALDRLLSQYGFYWYVDPNAGSGGGTITGASIFNAAVQAVANIVSGATQSAKPRIRFAERGKGPLVDVKYAKSRTAADFRTSNVNQFRARYSVAPTVNEVVVLGGRIYFEETIELQRISETKWAANEAAEYSELSTPPYRNQFDQKKGSPEAIIPDLAQMFPASHFGELAKEMPLTHIRRRRRFLPTINLTNVLDGSLGGQADLRPLGPQYGVDIEIIDREQDDSHVPDEKDKVWLNIAEHPLRHKMHVRVADDELAIYFDDGHSDDTRGDDEYDAFLRSLGSDKRLRVTGTIESDLRLMVRVKRKNADQAPSVQGRPSVFLWDAEKRFPCRRVMVLGKYRSKYGVKELNAQTPSATAVLEQMRQFGEQLLAGADQAVISGQIEFNHVDYDVPLGGIVQKVAGRDFHLLAAHTKEPKYPQIVALHYEFQENLLTATLTAEPENLLEAFA